VTIDTKVRATMRLLALERELVAALLLTCERIMAIVAQERFALLTGECTVGTKVNFAVRTANQVLAPITGQTVADPTTVSVIAIQAEGEPASASETVLALSAKPVVADFTRESVSTVETKVPFADATDEGTPHAFKTSSLTAHVAKSEQPAVIAGRFSASIIAGISVKAVNTGCSYFIALIAFEAKFTKTIVAGMEFTFVAISKFVPLFKVSTLATAVTTNNRHGAVGAAWIGRRQPILIMLLTTEELFLLEFSHPFQFGTMHVAKALA
jgi:hypothetical protein